MIEEEVHGPELRLLLRLRTLKHINDIEHERQYGFEDANLRSLTSRYHPEPAAVNFATKNRN